MLLARDPEVLQIRGTIAVSSDTVIRRREPQHQQFVLLVSESESRFFSSGSECEGISVTCFLFASFRTAAVTLLVAAMLTS